MRSYIIDAQPTDAQLRKVCDTQKDERAEGYSISSEGGLLWQGRLCVPRDKVILMEIMYEAHDTSYTVHPGSTKMYQDLKNSYWWPGMKKEIADFVGRCLICQQVKAPRQCPAGLLQPLNIPQWKWEEVSMNFISGLPKTHEVLM